MNYLFIQLNNIDIPQERFDILSIGEGIDVEMYLESPAHLLTYKGEEMTDVVEQSSIREDLGKYDFMALIRKPMIAVWMDTEQREWEFENKEEADSYYAVKTLSCTNLVQIFALGLWMVKDCSVYSDLSYWCNTVTTYSSKNRRSIQQLNAFGKAKMTFFNSEEISDAFGYMTPIMQIFAEARNNNAPIDSVYSQGTHVLNIEAALSNNGCSFYRILILLQLARKTGLLCEKISWYCAILESLFAIERNHKKNVSEMTAAFITDTEQEKMEVIHSMRMAYKIRSEIVHGSVRTLVCRYAQAALGKLSSEVDSYVRRALRKAFFDENINYEETTEDKKRVREYLRNNWPCRSSRMDTLVMMEVCFMFGKVLTYIWHQENKRSLLPSAY